MADNLSNRLSALATATGALIKTRVDGLRTLVFGGAGSLANLPTADKTSVLAALIEIHGQLGAGGGLDEAAVQAIVEDAIAELVGAAPGALDTIYEIAAAVGANDGAIAALTTAIGNRVRFDAAQALDAGQKTQARDNIGAAENVDTDFVALLEAGAA